ncbi:CDP-diacylglycerol--serine O-phosphatidyltransferase [Planctomycetota bacterium]
MSRTYRHNKRNRFWGRAKRRPLKRITILPSLITLLNGVLGFAAIVLASTPTGETPGTSSHFALAGYFILFAMVADMLDGRLARMSQTTSSFGGQLDSLCDMISFGVAPAFIMLKLIQTRLLVSGWAHTQFIQRFLWLAALAYVICAAIRLARFNVENEEPANEHMAFIGLPSPAAAGLVLSFVLFHQELIPDWNQVLWILPVLAFCAGALMVSRIPYPHVLNHFLRGKKPFGHLIKTLVFLGLVWCGGLQTALLLISISFASSGVVRVVLVKLGRKQEILASDTAAETLPPQPSSQENL